MGGGNNKWWAENLGNQFVVRWEKREVRGWRREGRVKERGEEEKRRIVFVGEGVD